MSDFFSTENLKNVHQNNPDSLLFAHLAARYIEENEFQKAIDLCNKGLNKHPNYAFGHFILGLAHYHIKNYTDAKKELEIALAYDPTSPKAWEVLSTINEILNLSDDATESNLNSYLIDYFNKDASPNFLPAEETPIPEIQDYVKPSEIHESDKTKELSSEVSEEEIDSIIKNAMSGDDNEFDFEQTLNEVFNERDTEENHEGVSEVKESPEQTKESEESLTEQKSEKSKDLEKESMVTADEFSSALESFFSKYEEKDNGNKPAEVELVDSLSETEETTPADVPSEDVTMPDEETTDSTIEVIPDKEKSQEETQEEIKKFPSGTDITFDEQQENLIDFSSVVSDIIKESEEPDMQEMKEANEEEEAEIPPGDYPTGSEKDIDIPTETDFTSPEMMPDEDQVESDQSSLIDIDLSPSEEVGSRKKPPILSPTLGEIYIAQGRFEEAIDVFKALLKKEPQNTRYKRKLEDVKKILTKKKSGS
jgi:tetratricopeptide (TPR) repeat protein